MLPTAEDRLMGLWLKAAATRDPAEAESLLWEFRNAVHEYLDQRRAEAKKLLTEVELTPMDSKPLKPALH
jgi:hypothetical protein